MKRQLYIYIFFSLSLCTMSACKDHLDLEPKNKLPGEVVLSDPNGVKAFIANLYYQAPIEDFVYFPREGFNSRGNHGSLALSQYSMEAIHSEWPNWNEYRNDWWDRGYKLNRSINLLLDAIPKLNIAESEKNVLMGEAAFLRAYTYFGLAKRYGGVPLITSVQEFDTNFENLRVQRSTEKETWDFVLAECDKAIGFLPENRESGDMSKRAATKWTAYALKSRAALHAASVAKFWNRAPLSGEAVSSKFIGIDASEANRYYQASIEASEGIMNSGRFSLYKPAPADAQEAATNYQAMFADPNVAASTEVIFMKGYANAGGHLAHDYDGWNNPNQTSEGFPFRGRTNPVLELVDLYENYSNPGQAAPVVTTTNGTPGTNSGYNPSVNYLKFNSPDEIFKDKDARFFASIIYPNARWKGVSIVIQGGIIKPDGTLIETRDSYTHNGVTYYTFGKENDNQYSGFNGSANMTRTGFLMRKFLNEASKIGSFRQSVTDYIDMRLAEVLLNYAEAVIESGYTQNNAQATAAKAINDIRKRAGHKTDIPLSLENVMRERTVELAFENKNYWDLIRRREFHTLFNNKLKTALVPMIDLRGATPQYIFVRKNVPGSSPTTFPEKDYYRHIPGISGNGVIQNPQH
jgi:starch-binding outer membrane protein, SusD/RagB family